LGGEPGRQRHSQNRQLWEAQALLISKDIQAGTFDYLKWFPQGNKANLFVQEKEKGRTKAEPKTIRQYYKDWKVDKVPPFVKKSRGRKYRSHFNAHILPFHGDRYMHLYDVAQIREIRTELIEKRRLSVKTAKNIIDATLRAFFRDATADKVIDKTPFDDLPEKWWPKVIKRPIDPFTEKERDEILAYFEAKYFHNNKGGWPQGFVFLYVQFWVGTRPSEITGRRWRDYDPRTGKLSIPSSRAEGEEGTTKTRKSDRTIELLPPIRKYLKQIKPIQARPDDYIFTNRVGKPIDQKEFAERHFWPALTALSVRHRDFYATRDTFISVMLSHNENSKRIAEYCGTSLGRIEENYGKWIGSNQAFGQAALKAANKRTKPKPKPFEKEGTGVEEIPVVPPLRMVRGGGFEPPRHFWH
jgi:integrase